MHSSTRSASTSRAPGRGGDETQNESDATVSSVVSAAALPPLLASGMSAAAGDCAALNAATANCSRHWRCCCSPPMTLLPLSLLPLLLRALLHPDTGAACRCCSLMQCQLHASRIPIKSHNNISTSLTPSSTTFCLFHPLPSPTCAAMHPLWAHTSGCCLIRLRRTCLLGLDVQAAHRNHEVAAGQVWSQDTYIYTHIYTC